MTQKCIFFHVGLAKTGSTFLQQRVFPKLRDIHYVPTNQYLNVKSKIQKSGSNKILVSREFDRQFEREVKKFAVNFPQATPIILLRRHDSYIASQFRRFVKNGFRGSFSDFFDLENDQGFFKKEHLDFSKQIDFLNQHFENNALVFLYEDLKKSPKEFVQTLALKMEAEIDLNQVDFSQKHASYSEKQLKFVQAVGKRINLRKRRIVKNGILHFLWRLWLGAIRYSVLFLGKIIPGKWVNSEPLIAETELKNVREFYDADWQKSQSLAVEI